MFQIHVNEAVSLHLLQKKHAQDFFDLIDKNREYLRVWLSWVDKTQTSSTLEMFIQHALTQFTDGTALHMAIYYNKEIVGGLGLTYDNPMGHSCTLGYWLSKDAQGKGIMTQSVAKILEYAFTFMNLNKVEIRVALDNKPSRAIPERLKFTHEGTIRAAQFLNGQYIDMVLYGLLKKEWLSC